MRRSGAPTVALRPRILRNRESRCARFQPRIYERLRLRLRKDRGDTNLLETFSTRDARVREREREGERYEVAEGRGERAERVLRQQRERKRFVLSLKRFFFESNGAALSESGR